MRFKDILNEELKRERLIEELSEKLAKNEEIEKKSDETYDQTVAKVMKDIETYKKLMKYNESIR